MLQCQEARRGLCPQGHLQEEPLHEDGKVPGHTHVGCLLSKKSGVQPPANASPGYWLQRTPSVTRIACENNV